MLILAYLFSKYLVYKKKDQKSFIVEGYVLKGKRIKSHLDYFRKQNHRPNNYSIKNQKKKLKELKNEILHLLEYINLERKFVL